MASDERMEFLCEPVTPPGRRPLALILLPGANIAAEAFAANGFTAALRRQAVPVLPVLVRAHLGYYLDESLLERLEADVVDPLRSSGYDRFWLAGISLGGLGALRVRQARLSGVEGALLLAPFLATTGVIAEIVKAGGLDRWSAPEAPASDRERRFLAWLKSLSSRAPELAGTYLACGTDDRFAAASGLLAQRLPAERIVGTPGGHDWPTWSTLWRLLLDLDPFGSPP